jgi:hypothetical protein
LHFCGIKKMIRPTNRQTAQKLSSVGHCPKINAIFNVDVGTRDRIIANYGPKVGMRLAKFDFLRSLSLKRTAVAAANINSGHNRRLAQSRWARKAQGGKPEGGPQ